MNRKLFKLVVIGLLVLSLLAIPYLAACASEPPLEEAEPIVLGLPCSMGYKFAQEAEMAVTVAIEQINAAGGVNVGGVKRPFKLVTIDTRDSAPGVPTADSLMAIEKLILEQHPTALIVGPNRSEVMLAAMELNAKYKMPQIGTCAKTPTFQQKILDDYAKYKYCFRITTTSVYMGMYHVDFCQELNKKYGLNKVFSIFQDVAWAKGTCGLVAKGLQDAGWEVVGSEAIPLGTTDFSIPLIKAKDSGAQVILIFFDMPEVSELMTQYAALKVPAMPVGVVGLLMDPKSWEQTGGSIEGLALHVCEAGDFPVASMPKSVEFYNAYKARWGVLPAEVAGQAPSYDSVYLMKAAIERAGTLDPDALVTALEATDMTGAIGRIRFGEDHQAPYGYDPEETAIGLFIQWQQPGVLKTVFPLSIADADIVLPPAMR